MFFVSMRASLVAVTAAAASEMRVHYGASVLGDAIDLRNRTWGQCGPLQALSP